MARVDEERAATRDAGRQDALDAYFAAARSATEPAGVAFLTAILADAAEVSAARAPAVPTRAEPARVGVWPRIRGVLDALGGWRGASALGACAAIGFWIGLAGDGDFAASVFEADSASSESVADPVSAFFDLASVEG